MTPTTQPVLSQVLKQIQNKAIDFDALHLDYNQSLSLTPVDLKLLSERSIYLELRIPHAAELIPAFVVYASKLVNLRSSRMVIFCSDADGRDMEYKLDQVKRVAVSCAGKSRIEKMVVESVYKCLKRAEDRRRASGALTCVDLVS